MIRSAAKKARAALKHWLCSRGQGLKGIAMETEKLKLPRIGFGTSGFRFSKKDCKAAVLKAIETGYTFVDTAQMYEHGTGEAQVGEAIAECGISRDDLIIATKIQPLNLSYKNVLKTTEVSLKKLGLKTVDLL
nr:aldo/keto reductase [Candidatus Sigynarchaeota archaeon]